MDFLDYVLFRSTSNYEELSVIIFGYNFDNDASRVPCLHQDVTILTCKDLECSSEEEATALLKCEELAEEQEERQEAEDD